MLFTNEKTHREYESPILIRRDELGMSMKELSRLSGCSYGTIYDLAYGKAWPFYIQSHRGPDGYVFKAYEIKPRVRQLCDVLQMDVEDAFPLHFCKVRNFQYDNNDMLVGAFTERASHDPFDLVSIHEMAFFAQDVLSKRQMDVIFLRIREEDTFQEICEVYGVTKECISQVFEKGLRIMRRRCGAKGVHWNGDEMD